MPDPTGADRVRRGLAEPLRPLRTYAPVMAVIGPVLLLLAVVLLVGALGAQRDVVATGSATGLVLAQGPGRELALYGALAGDGAPGQVRCTFDTGSRARVLTGFSTGSVDVEGRSYTRLGDVEAGWEPGDTVRCTGVDELVVLAGQGRAAGLAMAGLSVLVGLGALLLAVAGYRSRASYRARYGPDAAW